MSNNAPDYENNLAFDPDINTMPRCDIEALKSEVKRLKVLLRECKQMFIIEKSFLVKCSRLEDIENIITQIDNATGEKK